MPSFPVSICYRQIRGGGIVKNCLMSEKLACNVYVVTFRAKEYRMNPSSSGILWEIGYTVITRKTLWDKLISDTMNGDNMLGMFGVGFYLAS